jgi:preprotein translocase subunit SecG
MSVIDDLKAKWGEMDEIDRKNFWFGVVAFILIILVLLTVSDALGTIGSLFTSGSDYLNESVQEASKITKIT